MAEELTQLSVPNFPAELKETLEREAQKQDRSLASLLRTVLAEYAYGLVNDKPARKRPTESVAA